MRRHSGALASARGSDRKERYDRAVRVRAVWAIHGVILAATLVTYARLPPGATYRFNLTGLAGAVSRALTYLNFPVALAALALLWPLFRRPAARAAALLCAMAAVPGVVSTTTMEARWWNVPAACGVLLAVPLTMSLSHVREPLGTARALAISVLVALSTPWILAAAGVYARDIPPLGLLFRSAEPTPGDPGAASSPSPSPHFRWWPPPPAAPAGG